MEKEGGKDLPARQDWSSLPNGSFWGQRAGWGEERRGKGCAKGADKFTGLSVSQPEAETLPLQFPFI